MLVCVAHLYAVNPFNSCIRVHYHCNSLFELNTPFVTLEDKEQVDSV